MNEFEISWKDKVRDIKELSGMTLEEMETASGISMHTIKSWIYGEKTAKPYNQDGLLYRLRKHCVTRRTP